MIPKIFIINLDQSTDRRENMQSQLNQLGVDFTFFKATQGKGIPKGLSRYNPMNEKRYGITLSPGEIGCFSSHYSLWEKCLALAEPIIILEDDITVSKDFITTILHLSKHLGTLKYIRLNVSHEHMKHYPIHALSTPYRVVIYNKPPCGTQGYLITPEAAQRFIKHAKQWIQPVDLYMDNFWRHGNMNFSIYPFLVNASEHHSQSDIKSMSEKIKTHSKPIRQKIKREWFRIQWKLLRNSYFWLYRVKIKLFRYSNSL